MEGRFSPRILRSPTSDAAPRRPNLVRDTVPDGGPIVDDEVDQEDDGVGTNPYSDVELVDEDLSAIPPELAGKSQAELVAELKKLEETNRAQASGNDPATMLATQFSKFLEAQKPAAAPIPEGFRVKKGPAGANTPVDREAFKKRINERYLDDPLEASREVIANETAPLMLAQAETVAQMSRMLVELDPSTKEVYARYRSEIESDVAEITPLEKLQDPRLYHKAVERARARHFSEEIALTTSSQKEAIAKDYLKSLGFADDQIDGLIASKGSGVSPAPTAAASGTLASPGRASSAPSGANSTKTRIVLNADQRGRASSFAKARGVSLEAAVEYLKSKGQL